MGSVKTLRGYRIEFLCLAFACSLVVPSIEGRAQTGAVAGLTSGTFRVNESGAATYTIPIQVPPGIAGMEPKLSLVYNSQGGNGQLGLGWHLAGFSSVDRCGRSIVQDVVGAGVTYEAADPYCLDGQRLVLVSSSPPTYRTDRESYTKVVPTGFAGTGPMYFTAWTKSGQIIEYGNTPASRVEAQGKDSVRTYQVNKISDTKGNSITFEYNEDLPNGEVYPSAIKYAYNGAAFNAKVEFGYEDNRTDTLSSYLGGSLIKTTKRLISITTSAGTGAAVPARKYKLAYEYAPGGSSRVTSIQECNGDGTKCLPAHSFTWENGTVTNAFGVPVNWGSGSGLPVSSIWGTLLSAGDINGDGNADILWAVQGDPSPLLYVQYSNGNSFSAPVLVGTLSGSGNPDPVVLADVNFDGLADIVRSDGYVHLSSTGSGPGAPVFWGSGSGLPVLSIWGTLLSAGDINGDGYSDILWAVQGDPSPSLYVQYSTGHSFNAPVLVGTLSGSGNPDPVVLADVNGDGRADIVRSDGYVHLSTGSGFGAPVFWGSGSGLPVLSVWGTHLSAGDINGDGYSDILWAVQGDPSPLLYVQYSTGNSFSAPVLVGTLSGSGNPDPVVLADANGDGHADIVRSDSTEQIAQVGTPDYLKVFADSLGAQTTVFPLPLTDASVYSLSAPAISCPDTPTSGWWVRDRLRQGPMYVVSKTTASNGIGGTTDTTYKYFGAKVHLKGGGSLGFRRVEEVKRAEQPPANQIKTATVFRQDYPFQGLTTYTETTLPSSGALLSSVCNTWTTTVLSNPNNTDGYHRADLAMTVEAKNDLKNDQSVVALPTVTTTYQNPDPYGNVKDITVTTPDGYTKTTHHEYDNNTTDPYWLLGRLTRSTVTSTIPSNQ